MAPGQAVANRGRDSRSDIYARGAVAYFILTGRPPFEGPNALDILVRQARDPVVPLHELRQQIPLDLETLVLRCLEKDPDKRYCDVETLDRTLATCAAATGWTEARAAQWWHDLELPPAPPPLPLRPQIERRAVTSSPGYNHPGPTGIEMESQLAWRRTPFPPALPMRPAKGFKIEDYH